jgi:hypothetical protein
MILPYLSSRAKSPFCHPERRRSFACERSSQSKDLLL